MKDTIHPKVYTDAVVTCACGNKFTTMSTRQTISVDICSVCHPFYTGQQKFVDTEGRIDKFKKKQQVSDQLKQKEQEKKKTKVEKKQEAKTIDKQPTLKELLEQSRQSNS